MDIQNVTQYKFQILTNTNRLLDYEHIVSVEEIDNKLILINKHKTEFVFYTNNLQGYSKKIES